MAVFRSEHEYENGSCSSYMTCLGYSTAYSDGVANIMFRE